MNKTFPILAIETSSELCSVALIFNEKKFSEINFLDKHVHSESLMIFIDKLLEISKLKISEIKSIAVSSGPGSFTGIRIGYSAAKGIAFGLNLPIIPVPTFSAFAMELASFLGVGKSFCIAVKASSSDLYFGEYEVTAEQVLEKIPVQLINTSDLTIYANTKNVFSDFLSNVTIQNYLPKANFIGKWAANFGEQVKTFEYDFIEPNYLKKFIPKVKK